MRTVLYIANDKDNVLFVRKALEAEGYRVRWEANAPRGIAAARAGQPDVILLEMNLPGLDGYEVARQLRADARHPLFGVPIIALTTCDLPGAALDILAAGCDVCLVKPVTIHDLRAEVAEALRTDRWPGFAEPTGVGRTSAEILQAVEA